MPPLDSSTKAKFKYLHRLPKLHTTPNFYQLPYLLKSSTMLLGVLSIFVFATLVPTAAVAGLNSPAPKQCTRYANAESNSMSSTPAPESVPTPS
ncbi:hypothetical protein CROQUDRAFT_106945 [Cronartium quercuum f. sp. fusiforme G11]|uniref:Uncharacterized protein n=1 Tax=Cronartium quercuum f. sp. fusiforme G11 TaxID=708437 RepID=A0A9P6NNC0_9BASI|nr:hypothetical protein CROQUDRAFT_106945 [Cronartium quercuum f. sp. fusiforme G11]